MSNYNDVVLPGIADYSKVMSYELRSFDSTPTRVVVDNNQTLIASIKNDMQNSQTDNFPINTLQIPVANEETLPNLIEDDDDGNSSDPSE